MNNDTARGIFMCFNILQNGNFKETSFLRVEREQT